MNFKIAPFLPSFLALILASVIFLGLTNIASAQEAALDNETIEAEIAEGDLIRLAPVIVDGDELFLLRGNTALPAQERAENVQNHIISAAEASENTSVHVSVKDHELGRAIVVQGQIISVTTVADADFEQVELEVLAQLQADAIRNAIINYRSERTRESVVSSAVEALAWTVGFIFLSVFFFGFRVRFSNIIERIVERHFVSVEQVTKELVRGKAIAAMAGYVVRIFLFVAYFIMFYYYLSFVMLSFVQTRPIAEILLTYVTDPIIAILLGFVAYIPNLITLGIIAGITAMSLKGIRLFFENLEAGTFTIKNMERYWIWPTYNLVRAVIILIAVVFGFPFIPGSDSAAFQGLTILMGIMVSMGSNSVISNSLAGVFVIYRRSTGIGDRIKIGEHVGDVVQIKLMETHIKSIKNEMISIPNAQLLNSEVVNYSSKIDGRGLLLHTTVGIGYEENQDKIEAMLIKAANMTDGIKASPTPFVLWSALADYAINYQINGYTTRGAALPKIKSDLHRNIVTVFNDNKVQIMTPSYMADTEDPKYNSEVWDGVLAGDDNEPQTETATS